MSVQSNTQNMMREMSKVVIGQETFVSHLIVAFLSGGHVLMEGVPGIGKTLSAKALAKVVGGDFKRVQFTPDLMPADILGTHVFHMKDSEFQLKKGPIFTNILLADEINRTPPKTQSSLLEAMEERHVTIDGTSLPLGNPFFVVATQNPVEYEGTYPLPEAQLDRFLMKLQVEYFSQEQEDALLQKYTGNFVGSHESICELQTVLTEADRQACLEEIRAVRVEQGIVHYITSVTAATRRSPAIALGGSPRASIALLLCAKTVAAMQGRDFVTPEDVVDISLPVLRHRVLLKPEASMDGLSVDGVLQAIVKQIEIPR